ncbi:hypothetical protein GE09DRAFT_1125884 [Coniochaeta sp. 2T2.1]|nr:hypothetical protein GE09DRAFT_1125884 [Coniochaeta sp. 2T2.1]
MSLLLLLCCTRQQRGVDIWMIIVSTKDKNCERRSWEIRRVRQTETKACRKSTGVTSLGPLHCLFPIFPSSFLCFRPAS